MTSSFAFKVSSTWTTHSDRVEISLKPWRSWIHSFFCQVRSPLPICAMMNDSGRWLKGWINKWGRHWGNFSVKHKCSLLNGCMFYSKYPPQLSIAHAAAFHGCKVGFDMGYVYTLSIYIYTYLASLSSNSVYFPVINPCDNRENYKEALGVCWPPPSRSFPHISWHTPLYGT